MLFTQLSKYNTKIEFLLFTYYAEFYFQIMIPLFSYKGFSKLMENTTEAHFSLWSNLHLSKGTISVLPIKTYRFSTPKTYSCSADKRKIRSRVNKDSYKNGNSRNYLFSQWKYIIVRRKPHSGWQI